MGLAFLSTATPEPELRRVVCHVTGHLLGFQHSPLEPQVLQQVDHDQAYVWFRCGGRLGDVLTSSWVGTQCCECMSAAQPHISCWLLAATHTAALLPGPDKSACCLLLHAAVPPGRQTQAWNPSMVDQYLLQAPARESAASGAESVMGFWLPGGIMKHGQEVFGAGCITPADRAMCWAHYPKASGSVQLVVTDGDGQP